MMVLAGLVSGVLAVLAAVFLLPTISDLLSIVLGARSNDIPPAGPPATTPRFLFLIPAHDEEILIDACLASLLQIQYPAGAAETLVVADNCTDATAERVRARGVRCLERTNLEQRGKPWAVAWALERITLAGYDGVIVLDADSIVDPGFLPAPLARRSRPATRLQGRAGDYIDVSNPGESAVTRMARVWSAVRFQVVNAIKVRAGLNVPLGDGLCIGTGVLGRVRLVRAFALLGDLGDLREHDGRRGPLCRRRGCPPGRPGGSVAQPEREPCAMRWTAGPSGQVLRTYGPAILRSHRISTRQKLDCLAEMMALGPAAHLGTAVVLAAIAAFDGLSTGAC